MTRRTVLALALLLSLSSALQAQFSAGVSGGANLTFWQWYIQNLEFDLDFDPAPGWRAALQAEYRVAPALALRVELANQAFRNSLEVEILDILDGTTEKTRTPATYNTVGGSLFARISPLPKQRNFYVLTGPTLAYITHGWRRLQIEGLDDKWDIELDEEQINRAQWLAEFGAGYAFSFREKNQLLVELRYQYGLGKFTDAVNVTSGIQSVLLNVGYLRSF